MISPSLRSKSWAIPQFDIKDPSLVLYIPFWYPDSETTGATIISKDKNRHSGTVTGATWGKQGRTFAGVSDVITVPDAVSIRLGDSFSIEFWFNTTFTTKGLFQNNPSATNGNFNIGVFQNNTYYYAKDTGANSKEYSSQGAAVVNTGAWFHLVATRNGATFKDYVNGVLNVDKTDFVAGDLFTTGNITIGYASALAYWNGGIGEVRIYNNRVLTQGEVLNNYQVTKWRY